jgi:hypothetical protein
MCDEAIALTVTPRGFFRYEALAAALPCHLEVAPSKLTLKQLSF